MSLHPESFLSNIESLLCNTLLLVATGHRGFLYEREGLAQKLTWISETERSPSLNLETCFADDHEKRVLSEYSGIYQKIFLTK